jgi:thymidylate kinase
MIGCKGTFVVFLGTDGSGKSTIISSITPLLSERTNGAIIVKHLRPGLLPPLARLKGHAGAPAVPVLDPHVSAPSGFMGSLIRLTYYTIDYVFGYWFNIYPGLAKSNCLYLFDRYFYDYLYDQRRSRISLPGWIVSLFSRIIPAPDLILCLGAAPSIIHARKPELPQREIERQIIILRKFCNETPKAVWIDTGKSLKESINDVLVDVEKVISRCTVKK